MDFLSHFQSMLGAMVWTLSGLIEAETPTSDKNAIDMLGGWVATWARDLGADVTVYPQREVGNLVECRWNAHLPAKPILILCHLDTVHPTGSVEARPTHQEGDYLYGVGSYDMKGGITVVQTVLEELHKLNLFPQRPLTLFFNSDEEIGSHHSRRVVEELAMRSGLALVMEPAPAEDHVVTERKGVGIFEMEVLGKAAHSGSNPDHGVNAILESAHQIALVTELGNRDLGSTVIPTVIRGGTTHNVIPEECRVTFNVRVRYHREAERIGAALRDIGHDTLLKDAVVYVTGGFTRPPMEHNTLMQETFATLQTKAPFQVYEAAKGGGSDGNFTATLGVPTLDGLGPTGGGAHGDDEHVYVPSMARRAALLAHILRDWPPLPLA